MNQICFVDRDGVVNKMGDRGEDHINEAGRKQRYTAPWSFEEFELLPKVKAALELLGRLGFIRVLVTNQPDMSYGNLTVQDHESMMAEVAKLPFEDVYVCPHPVSEGCFYHKPKPGMLLAAAQKWQGNLSRSFIIGDTQSDIGAGRAAGCKTILIRAPYNNGLEADFYADSLLEAAYLIQHLLKGGLANDFICGHG